MPSGVCDLHDGCFKQVENQLKEANTKLDKLLSIDGPISAIGNRMTAVESSCLQAHHRISGLDRTLKTTGGRLWDIGLRVASVAGILGILVMMASK